MPKVEVLDRGFVDWHYDMMHGSDGTVFWASKISRGEVYPHMNRDKALRLYRHMLSSDPPHLEPFKFAGFSVLIKAPLFVARQLVRHNDKNWMEQSGRYTHFDGEFYVPSLERLGAKSKEPELVLKNTQRSIKAKLEEEYRLYSSLLKSRVEPEIARGVLGTNYYTTWFMHATLKTWMHILELRLDRHAQWETQQYAIAIEDAFRDMFPLVHEAWKTTTEKETE
jgi:thymidylate synthase (FAD)